jgi:hypothetical protein
MPAVLSALKSAVVSVVTSVANNLTILGGAKKMLVGILEVLFTVKTILADVKETLGLVKEILVVKEVHDIALVTILLASDETDLDKDIGAGDKNFFYLC